MKVGKWMIFSLAALAASQFASVAQAQDYPARQVTIVVPYPAGGFIDVATRFLAEGLRVKWNRPVVVLNKPGANGKIGLAELIRSEPDGYMLLANNDGGIALPPAVDPNFNFDFRKDYTPVAQVVETKFIIAVNGGLPVRTVSRASGLRQVRPR